MPFLAALALLFIGLKLAHVITWSWWIVLMPIYVPCVIVVVIGVLMIMGIRKLALH